MVAKPRVAQAYGRSTMKSLPLLLVFLLVSAVAHGQLLSPYKNVGPNDTFRFGIAMDLRQLLTSSMTLEATYKLYPRLAVRGRTGLTYWEDVFFLNSTYVGAHLSVGLQWFDYSPRKKRERFSYGFDIVGTGSRLTSQGWPSFNRVSQYSMGGGAVLDFSWIVPVTKRVYLDWSLLNLGYVVYQQEGTMWFSPVPGFGQSEMLFHYQGWSHALTFRPRMALRYRFNVPSRVSSWQVPEN